MNQLLYPQVKPEGAETPSVAAFMGEPEPEATHVSPLEAASINAQRLKGREDEEAAAFAERIARVIVVDPEALIGGDE